MQTPHAYVVRTSESTWIIAPFSEHISRLLHCCADLSMDAVLQTIAGIPVSLIMSADGGDVNWTIGDDVTAAMLLSMACRDRR